MDVFLKMHHNFSIETLFDIEKVLGIKLVVVEEES